LLNVTPRLNEILKSVLLPLKRWSELKIRSMAKRIIGFILSGYLRQPAILIMSLKITNKLKLN
jgi:hypothetical protein